MYSLNPQQRPEFLIPNAPGLTKLLLEKFESGLRTVGPERVLDKEILMMLNGTDELVRGWKIFHGEEILGDYLTIGEGSKFGRIYMGRLGMKNIQFSDASDRSGRDKFALIYWNQTLRWNDQNGSKYPTFQRMDGHDEINFP